MGRKRKQSPREDGHTSTRTLKIKGTVTKNWCKLSERSSFLVMKAINGAYQLVILNTVCDLGDGIDDDTIALLTDLCERWKHHIKTIKVPANKITEKTDTKQGKSRQTGTHPSDKDQRATLDKAIEVELRKKKQLENQLKDK